MFTLKEEDELAARAPNEPGEIENVRVVVRIRPMDKSELDAGSENIVRVDRLNRCITVEKPQSSASEPPKIYYFDNVFDGDSTQVRLKSPAHPHTFSIRNCAIFVRALN